MARVFISHSSRDNETAAKVTARLASKGIDKVFLDIDEKTGIPAGAQWERTLYEKIDGCHAVILILTANWFDSKWCFVEFAQARALGKAIFPVIVEPGGERFIAVIAPDIQYLDLSKDFEGGVSRLTDQLTELSLSTQGGFDWDIHRPPYPGLMAFEAEDAAVFFGRDDDIRRLMERLNARRVQGGPKLIAVLGASGSGKSSLIRAGVLPRLARDKHNWIVLPPFRPRLDPTAELTRAVTEQLGNLSEWRDWRERLTSETQARELAAMAETFREKAGARDAEILITIDQAEEIFTVTPPEQAQQFWRLLNAAAEEGSPFLTLMTLRSEYLNMLQKAAEGVVRFEEFSLGPMPLARVRQIIEGPARVAGLRVEEGLIGAAAADAGSDDALPLLAFTLRELYDRHGANQQLLLAYYRELGDPASGLNPLENSVRKRADEVISTVNPSAEELEALREAFVGPLVRVNEKGEYVRHPALFNALPAKAQPILVQLRDARLLVTRDDGGQNTIEVAHEALLRKWPRLRTWLDEEREFLIGKSRLEAALGDWERASDADKPAALLQGLVLSHACQWLIDHPHALSDAEKNFIDASQAQALAEKRRRLRNRVALVAAALLVVALTGLGLIWMKFEAARREALQRGVEATRLAFQSGGSLRANDLANAVKAALDAEDILSTPETRSALLQSLLALSPHLGTSLTVRDLRPEFLAVTPDSDDVLIGGLGGSVESWQPSRKELSRPVIAFKPKDAAIAIEPALRALVSTKDDGAIALLNDGRLMNVDPSDGRELAKPAMLAEDISKAAIGNERDGEWSPRLSRRAQSSPIHAALRVRSRAQSGVQRDSDCDRLCRLPWPSVGKHPAMPPSAMEQGGLMLVKLDVPSSASQNDRAAEQSTNRVSRL